MSALVQKLSFRNGLTPDEIQQGLWIGLMPVRRTVLNKLVVFDYDLNDGVAEASGLSDLLRKELCPLIISVGEARTGITPEGIVIFTANESAPRRQISYALQATTRAGLTIILQASSL